MKILITGGCGFIGSNFIHYILWEHPDWHIVNLDKLTYAGNLKNLEDVASDPRYKFIRGDIADRELVDRVFAQERPDAVVNFAAESHVDRSILDPSPFIETNVKGVQVLLEAVRKYPVQRFIQISTDEVYGSLGEEGYFTEDSPLMPNSPYAASKAAADLLCRAYHKAYGVPVIITRSSNNYGPYQFPEKLIPLMIRNALRGEPLPVYGKGENVRDWLYVEDNCRAIDLVLQKGRVGEIYNIGGGCEKRNIEVVQMICDILKNHPKTQHLTPKIQFIKDPRGAAHDFRYALDCRKIKEKLGWTPKVRFEEGLRRTVEWYLKHQDWVEGVITGEYSEYYQKVYGQG
ncbi:MAG TPA: dTDP-glucose 4,6-dehydratase [Desulfobacterales bacterium]|nr:dTDP-glucose 4,6-dehydratase [Desulfobacterales bacterium]